MATPAVRVKNLSDALTDPKVLTNTVIGDMVTAYVRYHMPYRDVSSMTDAEKATEFLKLLRQHIRSIVVSVEASSNSQTAVATAQEVAKTKFDMGPDS